MGIGYTRMRHQFLHPFRRIRNAFYPIVHIVDLAVSSKFPFNRLPNDRIIFLHDIGLDGKAVQRRFLQYGKISNSG